MNIRFEANVQNLQIAEHLPLNVGKLARFKGDVCFNFPQILSPFILVFGGYLTQRVNNYCFDF